MSTNDKIRDYIEQWQEDERARNARLAQFFDRMKKALEPAPEEPENKLWQPWKPAHNELYFWFDDHGIWSSYWSRSKDRDIDRFCNYNVFKTDEDAERYSRLAVFQRPLAMCIAETIAPNKIDRWRPGLAAFGINPDHPGRGVLMTTLTYVQILPLELYMRTTSQARKVLELLGAERIIAAIAGRPITPD